MERNKQERGAQLLERASWLELVAVVFVPHFFSAECRALSVPVVVVGVYTSKGPLGILRCGGRGQGTHFLGRGLGGTTAPWAAWQRGQKWPALMVVVRVMRQRHKSGE